MIKNKETIGRTALEFCHVFYRFAAGLGALFEPQRVLFSIPLKASYARKAGESAICKKREENSLAALPIVYLFFIIYSKSTVGQLQLKFNTL